MSTRNGLRVEKRTGTTGKPWMYVITKCFEFSVTYEDLATEYGLKPR